MWRLISEGIKKCSCSIALDSAVVTVQLLYTNHWREPFDINFFIINIIAKLKVVIGESFGVSITYDLESLFYMYFVGTVGCFVWKCSR